MREKALTYLLILAALVVTMPGCSRLKSPVAADELRASGFIEARTYTLAAELGGTVAEVPVSQGQRVSAGQLLIRLDDPGLARALEQAAAGVAAARSELAALERQPTAERLARAQAAVDAARADLQAAQAQRQLLLASYQPLDPPVSELHQADAAVTVAERGLILVQAQFDQVQAGPLEGELALGRSSLAQAEAQQRLVQLQLARLNILAPVDGVIGQLLIQPGEVAMAGSPLVQVLDPQNLSLTVFISQDRVARVRPAAAAAVWVDSYPGEIFLGTVRRIADQAQFTPTDVQTQEERVKLVFAVQVELSNTDGRLTAGMPADAVIQSQP